MYIYICIVLELEYMNKTSAPNPATKACHRLSGPWDCSNTTSRFRFLSASINLVLQISIESCRIVIQNVCLKQGKYIRTKNHCLPRIYDDLVQREGVLQHPRKTDVSTRNMWGTCEEHPYASLHCFFAGSEMIWGVAFCHVLPMLGLHLWLAYGSSMTTATREFNWSAGCLITSFTSGMVKSQKLRFHTPLS